MGRIICIVVCAVVLTIPASASAGVYLSKAEARGVVDDVLESGDFGVEYPDADWYVSYWVERARGCERVNWRVIDCDFTIFGEESADPDTGELELPYCDGVMRIRERWDEYVWSDSAGDCGWEPAY